MKPDKRWADVVICAYTDERWDQLVAAVQSLQGQTVLPKTVIVVVDHNPALLARARRELPSVVVVENVESRGLSGSRNCGIRAAAAPVIAFLDDDAVASPTWLEELTAPFDDAQVLGTGGSVEPWFVNGRPSWFPEEFNWVVGCSYRGLPTAASPVRNPIGCNMAFRREILVELGGFSSRIGRIGRRPLGCEETELCIRARQRWRNGFFLYTPTARVVHAVPPHRVALHYFIARCLAEGLSKAVVATELGAGDALSSERSYVLRTLPRGVVEGLNDAVFRRDYPGAQRATAIVAGLLATTLGYQVGKIRVRRARRSRPVITST